MPVTRVMAIVAAGLLAAACSKEEKKPSPAAAGGSAAVVDAWKKAGLTVGAFEPVDAAKYGGGDCKGGQVSGIDTVLCTYTTAELAKQAEAKGLEAIGEATGSAIAQGAVLLVIADRAKADPQGRTINQMMKLFRGK